MSIGFDYMLKCAEKNDKNAIFYVARAYDSGLGLSKERSVDWSIASAYYKRILQIQDLEQHGSEDSGYFEASTDICEPSYSILARLGEMYLKGGNWIAMDAGLASQYLNEAAEKATACGKGRLANKYYMQAEEASSMCE
jgi:elongation factor 2 kinase